MQLFGKPAREKPAGDMIHGEKECREESEFTLELADNILHYSSTPADAFRRACGTLAQVIHILTPDEQREETLKC